MKELELIQQGDVLFHLTDADEIPHGSEEIVRKDGFVVFAEGEHTGHAHRTRTHGVYLHRTPEGEMICRVKFRAEVVHEEHGTVVLSPGIYRIGRVREIDPFEESIRTVKD